MIQLDTHVLIWRELAPERLSPQAGSAIEAASIAGEAITISPITLWEIAQLASRGRIRLMVPIEEFMRNVEENYRVADITGPIVIEAARLQEPFPKDPMDRLIAATAMFENLTLITADRDILASKVCKLLW
jgi:PIN domain nuclease of toxin-antitoxin system